MKKYKLSYAFTVFFTVAFLLSVRYFDGEGAGILMFFGIASVVSAFINFKLNR